MNSTKNNIYYFYYFIINLHNILLSKTIFYNFKCPYCDMNTIKLHQ